MIETSGLYLKPKWYRFNGSNYISDKCLFFFFVLNAASTLVGH